MTETASRLDTAPGGDTPPDGLLPLTDDEAAERRKGFTRLLIIIVALVAGSLYFGVVRTVAVIAAVILMIMLHELGHFATAKWSGMKVTEYFLGFGPRIWSVRKGETEYGIKAIPAGGYVKIIGMNSLEEVDPADEPRTYRQQPYWQRLMVVCAGSTVHFIIA
ncbi:MAG TPA: site-2 protease family protein, partial [Acidimicrobiales bacterium]|nr:site-2 protease family protein [Acidimicrobiales bacterium]